jgi:hypothetical protein
MAGRRTAIPPVFVFGADVDDAGVDGGFPNLGAELEWETGEGVECRHGMDRRKEEGRGVGV